MTFTYELRIVSQDDGCVLATIGDHEPLSSLESLASSLKPTPGLEIVLQQVGNWVDNCECDCGCRTPPKDSLAIGRTAE